MISAVFLINSRGDIIISRVYRDDVSSSVVSTFRTTVIKAKEVGTLPPVTNLEGCTFFYTRHKNLFLVAVTRMNSNACMVFQFLFSLGQVFEGYFGEEYDEDAIRNNFTLVYELLDEVLDFGYPQNCALEVLQSYINFGNVRADAARAETMTTYITGARDWRREGIVYKKNEVYLDVLERVNLLLSSSGAVLRADVSGQIMMKAFLTGMPDCKFGLNDKLQMERDPGASGSSGGGSGGEGGASTRKAVKGVEIEDCSFHRCVQLGKFEADRTITFVPPDGEFELMRYRITENVNLPFKVMPVVEEVGATRVLLNIKAIANFSSQLTANNVVFKIPVPPTTANAFVSVTNGRAKYEPVERAVVWRVRRFVGGEECTLRGEVELIASTKPKPWVRPPINVDFQVPMFTSSGLHVRSLKVLPQKEQYTTTKWVRYVTRAGSYQIRI